MKHLEKLLTHLPKPDPEVGTFREHLKRRVLTTPVVVASFRTPFLWAAACACCLIAVLLVFVANPGIPNDMHARLWGTPSTPAGTPTPVAVQADDASLWDWSSLDADRALVERWVESQYGQSAPVINPMDAGEIFAVRKFKLADGRQILVYTAVPERSETVAVGF